MMLRTRMKNPTVMMRAGMSFLILGFLSFNFLRPSTALPRGLADALTGLFYGLAIGMLLMSIWRRRGRRPTE